MNRTYPKNNRREGGAFTRAEAGSENDGAAAGALRRGRTTQPQAGEMPSLSTSGFGIGSKHKRIALGVTGSIAAYKACEIIGRLRDKQIDVSVVMTKDAQEFIVPLTLQTLSGNRVLGGLFALADNMSPAHIALAQQIDLLLIAPATANVIAKLAAGIADDALTCLALSVSVPVLICPAMNERMFQHKITQRNVTCLKEAGYRFVGPERGRLVCGGQGLGHLAKVETIVHEALTILG